MSPSLFFILFLVCVALIGGLVVLFFSLKPQKESLTPTEEMKSHFEDTPLQKVIASLKNRLTANHACPKCKDQKYEVVQFDEDLQEVYCLGCGYKRFYHTDLLAGPHRESKRIKSTWPKEWLRDLQDSPCPECKNKNYSEFKMQMDVRYKIGNFGNTKNIILVLNSCKSCGLVNIYDRVRT